MPDAAIRGANIFMQHQLATIRDVRAPGRARFDHLNLRAGFLDTRGQAEACHDRVEERRLLDGFRQVHGHTSDRGPARSKCILRVR